MDRAGMDHAGMDLAGCAREVLLCHGSQLLPCTPSILKRSRVLRAFPSNVCPRSASGTSRTVLALRTEAVVGAVGAVGAHDGAPAAAQGPGGRYAEDANFTLPTVVL